MTIWRGISARTSPVDDNEGVSEWQQNTRMRKQMELQRRDGFLSTAIAQQTGPVYEIVSASGPGGNFLTFNLDGGIVGFVVAGGGGGGGPWPPPPQPPKKRRPKGDRQVCTSWGPFADGGPDSAGPLTFTLPRGSCPGTLNFTATEGVGGSGGSGAGGDFGYSCDVTANGVPIMASGCLVNNAVAVEIPAGTLSIEYTVTASCVGGLIPGEWHITAQST